MPVTPQEADSILRFFIAELQQNGYGSVVQQVNVRLQRNPELQDYIGTPFSLLTEFMNETMNILTTMSNTNYEALLGKLNQNFGEEGIEVMVIQGLDQETPILQNLRDAPTYLPLVEQIRQIQREILIENELP